MDTKTQLKLYYDKYIDAQRRARSIGSATAAKSSSASKSTKSSTTKPSISTNSTKATKSSSSSYKPPAYNEAAYSKGINTSFYSNAAKQFTAQAEKNRATQLGEAQKQQQAALRQAYINRAQNQLTLNQNLATAGIRGGATETSNLRLANQYGQAVGAANTDYANSVNAINQNIDQSIFDYQQDMAARAEEYRQNQMNARWQAAREDYANKVNIYREDKNNAYQRKQAEVQRQTEYWSNYYINKYSGYSKKDLKKAEKDIKAKLKKAKTQYEKIRWQQALSGIGARRGVIKNK